MDERGLKRVKLLALDVDGVLTDGRIVFNHLGEEIKSFHVRDGFGLKVLMKAGIQVAIITGRKSGVVEMRARELGIRTVYQGIRNKGPLLDKLLEEKGLTAEETCCVGDDLPDLPLLRRAGISVAVADAAPEVRDAAVLITENKGGCGAVREVCEWILKAQGKWSDRMWDDV